MGERSPSAIWHRVDGQETAQIFTLTSRLAGRREAGDASAAAREADEAVLHRSWTTRTLTFCKRVDSGDGNA